MKKILIVIHDMKLGGAQKSLLSFLQGLCMSEYSKDYQIHLMMTQPSGELRSQLPAQVVQIPPSKELLWMSSHLGLGLLKHFSWKGLWGELCWIFGKSLGRFPGQYNRAQQMWKCWKKRIPAVEESYDVAISYIDGCPNYFVMDKVKAAKKILWYHSQYQKHSYDPEFDQPYLENCHKIITVSEPCRQCLLEAFPQYGDKLRVLENITVKQQVLARSEEPGAQEYGDTPLVKLLTVARLHPLKGIDLAVDAAKCLKDRGFGFLWLVVGEGAQRPQLQQKIEQYGLQEQFVLLGARENPYPYMARCDLLIQPSRVEGKSIVLDEAMVLGKPAVVTNYDTVSASVTHGVNGWIVELTGQAICDGIVHVWQDKALREEMIGNIKENIRGTEKALGRYVAEMLL